MAGFARRGVLPATATQLPWRDGAGHWPSYCPAPSWLTCRACSVSWTLGSPAAECGTAYSSSSAAGASAERVSLGRRWGLCFFRGWLRVPRPLGGIHRVPALASPWRDFCAAAFVAGLGGGSWRERRGDQLAWLGWACGLAPWASSCCSLAAWTLVRGSGGQHYTGAADSGSCRPEFSPALAGALDLDLELWLRRGAGPT